MDKVKQLTIIASTLNTHLSTPLRFALGPTQPVWKEVITVVVWLHL
jgi:hypothetical protein